MGRLTVAFIAACLAGPALADDTDTRDLIQLNTGIVVAVERGDRIPFDGIALDDQAAARLNARLRTEEQACDVRVTDALARAEVLETHRATLADVELKSCEVSAASTLAACQRDLSSLTTRLEQAEHTKFKSGVVYSAGLASGIVVTAVSAWIVSQVVQGQAE